MGRAGRVLDRIGAPEQLDLRGPLVKPNSRKPIDDLRNLTGFGNSHSKSVESYLEEVSQMNE